MDSKIDKKIILMLESRGTLTFEEIEDKLGLDHDVFMSIITSMHTDRLIINGTKETVSLIPKPRK